MHTTQQMYLSLLRKSDEKNEEDHHLNDTLLEYFEHRWNNFLGKIFLGSGGDAL